jgi:hypothetical protein
MPANRKLREAERIPERRAHFCAIDDSKTGPIF